MCRRRRHQSPGGVFDRQARHAGLRRAAHVAFHARGIGREAGLEVGIHGDVHRGHHYAQVLDHLVHGRAVVGPRLRPRKTGAGGGHGREAQALQVARAARVPGVGNDKAASAVQLAECAALVSNARASVVHVVRHLAYAFNESVEVVLLHSEKRSGSARRKIKR
jgi:hypothetical protein